ncbi:MAG TPA: DoxX family protein [Fimbriimonadaceae bacterium]|nr:DoxX family protein [Fimbriimonadaceae bacterium]
MAEQTDLRAQGFSLLLIRVVLGVIMVYYGCQNVFALFGGQGFYATSQTFADSLGLPLAVGQSAMIIQFAGGVLILLGLMSRLSGLLVALVMTVAAAWGAQATESIVKTTSADPLAAVGYPTCLVVMALVLFLLGGGMGSVDAVIASKRRRRRVVTSA